MLFSSIEFIFVFLPTFLILYFLTPKKSKNAVLLIFSLIFYAWGEPRFLPLMVFTVTLDWAFGILIEKKRERAKLFLAIAVISNLGILGIFKYLSPTLNFLGLRGVTLALPIGISFYTFQCLSYVIDVYRGEPAQKSPVAFGTYITMFPQLIAGPIVKYSDISSELTERHVDSASAAQGILRFTSGLWKKLIFANGAGAMWSYFSSLQGSQLSTLGAWAGIIFFAFQIYFDFSGYSDMAIGLGGLLGFTFPENFNYPYTADSIRSFWHRWHISLSSWFREYLYIPLGGNRKGLPRTLFNMLAVWLLTGIWHGAGFNFLMWGGYYFILLACEKLFMDRLLKRLPSPLRHVYALFLILVGWVFFALPSVGDVFSYFGRMFSLSPSSGTELYQIIRNIPFLTVMLLAATPYPKMAAERITRRRGGLKFALSLSSLFAFIICVANLIGSSYNPFLYFRF
ncbi:MAG: MBOAT family protein [Clostridia bacterium]|nr:MBOAT family protein [Clostridia bacterium]